MKIGAVTLAYNDEAIIGGTLRNLKPFVDRHIVLISEKPYFGKQSPADRTGDIAEELGADVIRGSWPLDNFQRNIGNVMCADCDWVLGFDSDEMMTGADIEKLLSILGEIKIPAVGINPEVYWKTTDYRLRPKPTYCPIIAMKPRVRFTHIRNIDSEYTVTDRVEMHHLSWCDPKDIYKKVTCYAHAPDFDGAKWYEEKYKKWEPGMKAELPDGAYDAIKYPLPDELKKCLSISQ